MRTWALASSSLSLLLACHTATKDSITPTQASTQEPAVEAAPKERDASINPGSDPEVLTPKTPFSAVWDGERTAGGTIGASNNIPTETMDPHTSSRVANMIQARRSRILDCYNDELAKDPSLSGTIVVYFDIDEEETESVDVSGMTESLQSCIQDKISRWRFEGVKDAPGVELTYKLKPSD